MKQNSTNRGALHNIVKGIRTMCPKDDEVIVLLDGDDWFSGPNALEILNLFYSWESPSPLLTYGRFKVHNKNNTPGNATWMKDGSIGYSEPISESTVTNRDFRKRGWVFSHLRTFSYKLWKTIDDARLRDENGNYFRVTWDMAFMFEMLEKAPTRIKYTNYPFYVYNVDNPSNDFRKRALEQAKMEQLIRSRPQADELTFENDVTHE